MRARIALLMLFIAGTAQAGLDVAPNANTNTVGNVLGTAAPFGEGVPNEFQWQLSGSQLTAMLASNITAIGFRLCNYCPSIAAGASFGTWDLQLSSAANA